MKMPVKIMIYYDIKKYSVSIIQRIQEKIKFENFYFRGFAV